MAFVGNKSKKSPSEVNPIEQTVRRALRPGMIDGVRVTVEFVSGFEMFGSYENWGQGWRIVDHECLDHYGNPLVVHSKFLEDAVAGWYKKREALS